MVLTQIDLKDIRIALMLSKLSRVNEINIFAIHLAIKTILYLYILPKFEYFNNLSWERIELLKKLSYVDFTKISNQYL